MKRCPRGLTHCTSECSLGLHNVETSGEEGCEWGINDALSYYCFWEHIKKHSTAYTDKEISRLLCIPPSVVKTLADSGIKKLRECSGSDHLQVLLGDMLRSEGVDDSIYDSPDDDIHMFSRHKGEYGDNMVHNNGKAQVFGLSRNWFNHIDKRKYKMTKGKKK
jgi:hypothetical protein